MSKLDWDTSSLRGSWVQIPPPAPFGNCMYTISNFCASCLLVSNESKNLFRATDMHLAGDDLATLLFHILKPKRKKSADIGKR